MTNFCKEDVGLLDIFWTLAEVWSSSYHSIVTHSMWQKLMFEAVAITVRFRSELNCQKKLYYRWSRKKKANVY